jgi:NitT/TauT family transport system substrate-binding protein
VQALVNSWFATLAYMQTQPDAAYEVMAKRAGVSLEEYKAYADGTRIFTIEDNLKAFQPGNSMASLQFSAEKMSEFLVETGLVAQKPVTQNIFDDRFVKAYAEKAQVSLLPTLP